MCYPKDYFSSSSTALFTAEQDGAFFNLLMRSWNSDPPCTLPDDHAVLAQLSKLGDRWSTAGAPVLARFDSLDGLLRNRKLYEVYLEMESQYRRRSKAAKDREKRRKSSGAQSDHAVGTLWHAVPQSDHAVVLPSSSSSPSSSSYSKEELCEWFDAAFWPAYPRKTAKDIARRAIERLAPGAALRGAILTAVQRHRESDQWQRGFIPHASTWLNQKRWQDELPGAAGGQPGSGRKAGARVVIGSTEIKPIDGFTPIRAGRGD